MNSEQALGPSCFLSNQNNFLCPVGGGRPQFSSDLNFARATHHREYRQCTEIDPQGMQDQESTPMSDCSLPIDNNSGSRGIRDQVDEFEEETLNFEENNHDRTPKYGRRSANSQRKEPSVGRRKAKLTQKATALRKKLRTTSTKAVPQYKNTAGCGKIRRREPIFNQRDIKGFRGRKGTSPRARISSQLEECAFDFGSRSTSEKSSFSHVRRTSLHEGSCL